MSARWIGALLAAALMAGCGGGSPPGAVATKPAARGSGRAATGSPAPPAVPGVLTVLSPLGLNIHSGPALTAPRVGTAAQGAALTVLDHQDQNGGWYQVKGETVTGWVTADPGLTSPGAFIAYQSSDFGFNALYPQTWTFAATPTAVVFHPLSGPQTIVVRIGARIADFGPAGGAGYLRSGQQAVVVCGVTGDLNTFTHEGAAPVAPAPGMPGPLALLAQLRLHLDPSHALALDFNYSTASDLGVFTAFYNSMTFPFPQCMQTAPVPTP